MVKLVSFLSQKFVLEQGEKGCKTPRCVSKQEKCVNNLGKMFEKERKLFQKERACVKCVLTRKELCQKKGIISLEKAGEMCQKKGEGCKKGKDRIKKKREVC
jgi:hypothetical protein